MRATGKTPLEHYNELHNAAYVKGEVGKLDVTCVNDKDRVRACPKVPGGLGIPQWRKMSKATAKWMIKEGKLPPTEENLMRAGMKKAPKKRESQEEKLAKLLAKLQAENEGLRDT